MSDGRISPLTMPQHAATSPDGFVPRRAQNYLPWKIKSSKDSRAGKVRPDSGIREVGPVVERGFFVPEYSIRVTQHV
jgi:hypothetical protein